jgi:hypothetical protein
VAAEDRRDSLRLRGTDRCRCVSVGSPKQYAQYRQLVSAEQAAEIAAQEKAEFEPQEFSDSTIETGH